MVLPALVSRQELTAQSEMPMAGLSSYLRPWQGLESCARSRCSSREGCSRYSYYYYLVLPYMHPISRYYVEAMQQQTESWYVSTTLLHHPSVQCIMGPHGYPPIQSAVPPEPTPTWEETAYILVQGHFSTSFIQPPRAIGSPTA
jgi:hypothetical protein